MGAWTAPKLRCKQWKQTRTGAIQSGRPGHGCHALLLDSDIDYVLRVATSYGLFS